MSKVIASITTSVDGYITGPDDGPEYGLGKGGERLHYWVMGGPWTYEGGHDFAMHGPDKEFYDELDLDDRVRGRRPRHVRRGRRVGRDQPLPRAPVRAHPPHRGPARRGGRLQVRLRPRRRHWPRRPRRPGTATSRIGGGADVIRQALAAGQVDELVISTAPVILGAGKRLFDGFDRDIDLEVAKVYSSPYATHVRYTVHDH